MYNGVENLMDVHFNRKTKIKLNKIKNENKKQVEMLKEEKNVNIFSCTRRKLYSKAFLIEYNGCIQSGIKYKQQVIRHHSKNILTNICKKRYRHATFSTHDFRSIAENKQRGNKE